MDSKLRCVFELPEDAQVIQNNIDASATPPAKAEPPKPSPKVM